jgi:hypothetical protein
MLWGWLNFLYVDDVRTSREISLALILRVPFAAVRVTSFGFAIPNFLPFPTELTFEGSHKFKFEGLERFLTV